MPPLSLRHKLLPALLLCSPLTQACGPDFPAQLFEERQQTLQNLPAGYFVREIQGLGKAADPLWKVAEVDDYSHDSEREQAEKAVLPAETFRLVQGVRSGMLRAEHLVNLPPLVRAYTLAAVAYHKNKLDTARQLFAQALDAPVEEPYALYRIWALYMSGRLATGAEQLAAFAQLRQEVVAGRPDPLGMAVASLGEEAGWYWRNQQDMPKAVALYAQQMAAGSRSGLASLQAMARQITTDLAANDQARNQQAMRWLEDAQVRRLYLSYLYAVEIPYEELSSVVPDKAITLLTQVLEKQPPEAVNGTSRLAAVAWRFGRYELAARWAQQGDDPLGWWIRAKAAARQGQTAAARAAYDTALSRFTELAALTNTRTDQKTACRVGGERAILALADGQFTQAAELLKPGLDLDLYWLDLAYLAESVLTLDELAAFVQKVTPANLNSIASKDGEQAGEGAQALYRRLNDLYARRLLRAGRFTEAEAAFRHSDYQQLAQQYHQLLERSSATATPDKLERAQVWFEAGKLARASGMEIMGYEASPDYFVFGGLFHFVTPVQGTRLQRAEADRVEQNTPRINLRYHYRTVAAEHAEQAADLLPPRSQAYAAVLCWGAQWSMASDPAKAKALYQRYVQKGALVPWADKFGQQCPEPVFAAAAVKGKT